MLSFVLLSYFFFTHSATTEIYTLSLHDALPILYLVLKFTSTGTPAGEPPATRSALESFTLPLVSASPPREDTVPSRSTTPPRPAEESRKHVQARFSALIASLASSGVSEVSSCFTGPAVPARLNLPACR